ncbi:MAG: hypothetical protein CMJ19_25125 [Phycisphaeraceae bacterium]|nr:hypothetical protein [Phycisphaeraceae bacterium]
MLPTDIGDNINGPSLIRVPKWVSNPLGKYYLYFAHHGGKYIRLAYADQLTGPWQIYQPGVLHLDQTICQRHIASPDVHLDHENQRLIMYYHGPYGDAQRSFVSTSNDGLNFTTQTNNLGPFYFRVFEHEGYHYAFAKNTNIDTVLLRSKDGMTNFEEGPHFLPNARHTAILKRGDQLSLFYTRFRDAPEHIMVSNMSLQGDWQNWQPGEPSMVMKPEMDFEGVNEPLIPSQPGPIAGMVNQLRDPAIYEEDGKVYLLYSCAGEHAIAIGQLFEE